MWKLNLGYSRLVAVICFGGEFSPFCEKYFFKKHSVTNSVFKKITKEKKKKENCQKPPQLPTI
jgi:hypothetical protein